MLKVFALGAVLYALAPAAWAQDATQGADLRQIAQTLADRIIAATKVEDRAERRRQMREAALPVIDFTAMANGVLNFAGAKIPDGRAGEVSERMVSFLMAAIAVEVERLRPQTATVGEVEWKGEDEGRVALSWTGLMDSMDGRWRFKRANGGWKLADIEARGSTLTAFFGERLARYAQEVDQLLSYLRQQEASLQK